MADDQVSQARFQLKARRVIGGALVVGIAGGLLALAVSALAGSAFVAAVRRRLEESDVPPGAMASAMARENWARAKAATAAGMVVWRDGQPAAAAAPQPD
jgi:hypothetical protein